MAKTARNTVSTSSIRTTNSTTTLRPAGAKTPQTTAPARITHEQIARRAHDIWVKNGCKHGQDEQNWLDAERQLKAELGNK
ncbi:MAG: DUF2934 domain-containing protein [Planctomycetes bacterium]|nr:DUF2934 domain-containing protein [Planctomycetota bacterium]